MPKADKSAHTDQQQRQKGAARPETDKRARAALEKRHGGSKLNARGKVPFGPVGGSGRKTNLARSS